MNARERLEQYLENNGMLPDQAVVVMDLAIPEIDNLVPDYDITWDRDEGGYPDNMYILWTIQLRPIALKWIDENAPMAWFRDMFDDKAVEDMKKEMDKQG